MLKGSDLKRYARLLSLGFVEQAIASGGSLVFTLLLAAQLTPSDFGGFSVMWSVVMLLKSTFWGVLGQVTPAVAVRAPLQRAGQVRHALFTTSLRWSLVVYVPSMLVGLVMLGSGVEFGAMVFGSSAAALALRLQQVFRRIYYLEQWRGLALVSAGAFSAVLIGSLLVARSLGQSSILVALSCWTLALLASSGVGLARRATFERPSPRLQRWFERRSLHLGSPLVPSGILFLDQHLVCRRHRRRLYKPGGERRASPAPNSVHAGPAGIGGYSYRGSAANSWRLRYSPADTGRVAAACVVLFVGVAIGYGVLAVLFGQFGLGLLFGTKYALIGEVAILIMAIGTVAEALRTASASVLTAVGRTRPVLYGWAASTASW